MKLRGRLRACTVGAVTGALVLIALPASAQVPTGSFDASGPDISAADASPCVELPARGPDEDPLTPEEILQISKGRPTCFQMERFVEDMSVWYDRIEAAVQPFQDSPLFHLYATEFEQLVASIGLARDMLEAFSLVDFAGVTNQVAGMVGDALGGFTDALNGAFTSVGDATGGAFDSLFSALDSVFGGLAGGLFEAFGFDPETENPFGDFLSDFSGEGFGAIGFGFPGLPGGGGDGGGGFGLFPMPTDLFGSVFSGGGGGESGLLELFPDVGFEGVLGKVDQFSLLGGADLLTSSFGQLTSVAEMLGETIVEIDLEGGECPSGPPVEAIGTLNHIKDQLDIATGLLPDDLNLVAVAGGTVAPFPTKFITVPLKLAMSKVAFLAQVLGDINGVCGAVRNSELNQVMDEKINELLVQSTRDVAMLSLLSQDNDSLSAAVSEARAEIAAVDSAVRAVDSQVDIAREQLAAVDLTGQVTLEQIGALLDGTATLQDLAEQQAQMATQQNTQLAAIATTTEGVAASLGGVAADVVRVGTGVAGLQDSASTLQETADRLEVKNDGLHVRAKALSFGIADVGASVTDVGTQVSDLATSVVERTDALGTSVTAVDDRVGSVGGAVDGVSLALTERSLALQTDIAGVNGAVAHVDGQLNQRADGLQTGITNLDGSLSSVRETLTQAVDLLLGRIGAQTTTLQADTAALGSALADVDAAVAAVDGALQATGGVVATIAAAVNALDAKFSELRERFDTFWTVQQEARAGIDANRAAIHALSQHDLETALSTCEPIVSLILPASQGGRIDEVDVYVDELIERATAAAWPPSMVDKARQAHTKARAARDQGKFLDAYAQYCIAYGQLA